MNKYRVDRASSLVVPVGMNSILYIGDSLSEALKVLTYCEPRRNVWDQPDNSYGLLLSIWNDERREYTIKRSKGI